MKYTTLGRTGLTISRLAFGGTHIGETVDEAASKRLVDAALDAGISTFYTGDDYNNGDAERFMGAALRGRRDSAVLIAKTGYRVGAHTAYSTNGAPADVAEDYGRQRSGDLDHDALRAHGVWPTDRGMSRKHLTLALEASLRRLGTDYIDVYAPHYWDPHVPVEETLDTLNGFVQQGKVRYLACSAHTMWQLYRALWVSDRGALARYEAIQANFSLFERAAATSELPALQEVGVSLLANLTDAGGFLSGGFRRGDELPTGGSSRQRYLDPFWNEPSFDALGRLDAMAADFGRTAGELAEAWVLAQPQVACLLVGPDDPEELTRRAVAGDRPLNAEELATVDEFARSLPTSLRNAGPMLDAGAAA